MDNQVRDKLIKDLDDLENYLNLHKQVINTTLRYGLWIYTMWIIVGVELSVIIYDMTLPVYQSLFLPYVACWCLAFLGKELARREGLGYIRKIRAMKEQEENEDYQLLTGESRPG